MAEPITHLEKTIAGEVTPVTHLEQVIAEYGGGNVYENLEAGTNILIEETADGKAKISASGEVSSEDTVARAEIAAIKDGETLDSFGDVETALATKANSADVYSKTAVDTALSSKQDTISDLSTIRSGAALGATAVQPETGKGLSTNDYTNAEKTKLAGIEAQANKTTVDDALSGSSTNPVQNKVVKSALDGKANASTTYTKTEVDTALSGKQNAIDSTHKLSADLVDDTNATNKFATAEELEQIETNKNNISTTQNELALFNHATGSSIFFSETQPYGEMISGSYWISTNGVKIATRSSNQLFSGYLRSGLWSSVDTISDSGHFAYRSFRTYLPAGTYTISFASAVNIVRQIADNTLTENIGTNLTEYTLTTTTNNYIGFSFRLAGSTMSPWDDSNIMLNAGSTAMSYEPYVTWA